MTPSTFIASYVSYASARTSAPTHFHELAALSVLAAALGHRVYVEAAWGRIYPSLWIGLIGPSAVHKSTSANLATGLLAAADPDACLPQDTTREALYDTLAVRPYGLMKWSEFGNQLESLGKDYNAGLLSFLTEVFDSAPVITRNTKGSGLIRIEYPALSILAAGKLRWLQENLSKKQLAGGWLGRWLFSVEHKNEGKLRPMFGLNGATPEAAMEQRASLVRHLTTLAQCNERVVEHGDGGTVIDDWAQEMEGQYDDTSDPAEFSQRAATQVTKLTLAIQASGGPTELRALDPEAAGTAIDLWNYTFDCGRYLMEAVTSHSHDADEIQRILGIIKANSPITRRALMRRARVLKRHLDECLETITEGGLVEVNKVPNESGPATAWYTYKGAK